MSFLLGVALIIGAAALVSALGAGLAAFWRWRFARAAKALGLERKGQDFVGRRSDLSVRMAHEHRFVGTRRKRHRNSDETYEVGVYRWYTTVGVTLTAACPMSLRIWSVDRLGRMAALASDQPEWTLGASDVERAYDFESSEPTFEDARATIRRPEVLASLRALRRVPFDLTLTGRELLLERRGRVVWTPTLRAALDTLVLLGRALIDVQPEVHAQSPREVCARDWSKVAATHGFELRDQSMEGRLGSARFSMITELATGERVTRVSLTFDAPLSEHLAIRAAGTVDRVREVVGLHDIRTGDPAFDDRFRVDGAPRELVLALLAPTVRSSLASLADRGELTVDASKVALVVPGVAPRDDVRAIIDGFGELAALGSSTDGPFR